MKNVLIIGGGTGTYTLLSGLKHYPLNLSVIVSTADDGGSTGLLRRAWGVMPPGDIRQCLLGLSFASAKTQTEFAYRYSSGPLRGHTVGNILLASWEKMFGGVKPAIEAASRLLKVKGQVLPVTLKPTNLKARLSNGRILSGEHNIDEPKARNSYRITKLFLQPSMAANPEVLRAIRRADAIIFGPGDLYTSVLPNILVPKVAGEINRSRAKKFLVANIMTKFGQTNGFQVSDFVLTLEQYLHGKINTVVANNRAPSAGLLKVYANERAQPVSVDQLNLVKLKVEVVAADLLSAKLVKPQAADRLKRSLLRHDPKKLAKLIYQLV